MVRHGLPLTVAICIASTCPAQTLSGHFAVPGERRLWLDCRGTGSPAVILEAGHGETSATWDAVHARIASITRACRYDRAGLGRSDQAPGVRSGREVVADLHAVLQAARVTGPFVLAGHSLGGGFVRLYASAWPRDVAGLVLIDAVHENEFTRIDELLAPAQRQAGAGIRPMSSEGIDIERVFDELRALSRPGDLPVRVIGRGRPLDDDEMPPDWTPAQRAARERLRKELQADLARRAGRGTVEWATKSGHFVHHDEPDLVVAAIEALVTRTRTARQ